MMLIKIIVSLHVNHVMMFSLCFFSNMSLQVKHVMMFSLCLSLHVNYVMMFSLCISVISFHFMYDV